MRTITLIIIHCSAVPLGRQSSALDIDRWHRASGYKSIGYHFVVRRDGNIETGRRLEEIGAHCADHNRHSIGICYEGGLDKDWQPTDTRTPEQRKSLRELVERMHAYFPEALIVGHHDLNPMKACPCFDVAAEYKDLQPV